MSPNGAIIPIDPSILQLIHGSFGKDGSLQPFAREIMLIECHVAGTSYVPIKTIEPDLRPTDTLVLKREPDNEHDPLAIIIIDTKGRKLGYVPKVKNEALARLMDAGKLLFAKLVRKEWKSDWLHLEAKVYLRDL
jgi:hypothetical protein